jgi:hypothetical protein
MDKRRLKTLVKQLKDITFELECELYSDPNAYHISSSTETTTTYRDTSDEEGLCD